MNVEDETVLASIHCRHRATELKKFLTKIDKNVSDHLDVPKYARSRFFKAREDGDDGGRRTASSAVNRRCDSGWARRI